MKRAEDGTRTRYLQLGKLSLYQVSYFRLLSVPRNYIARLLATNYKFVVQFKKQIQEMKFFL
jgi:hypothetical protein